jgi:AcrR family transcriptional regulator
MVTSARSPPPVRDSRAMRRRLMEALGRLIVREGVAGVGVNALAREAGCDKVLIYRYFGDLAGVWGAFAESCDFWWSLDEITADIDPAAVGAAGALKTIVRRHAQAIRSRPVTLAVLASEPGRRTPLVTALEAVRERRSLALLEWIGRRYRLPASADLPVIAMLLGVAINALAVRARDIRVMNGVTIETEADWARLYAAIDVLIDGALQGA